MSVVDWVCKKISLESTSEQLSAITISRQQVLPSKLDACANVTTCCWVVQVLEAVSIKHGLRTADYGLRTGYKIRTRYKTRTRKYGLGIKHGQGIKRGLRTGYKIRTTDYFGKNRANWF